MIVGASGCDPGTPGADAACPDVQPLTCPPTAPSFASQVAAIVDTRCATCHNLAGQNPDVLLTTYAQIHARRTSVLTQTTACRMPPAGATPLSLVERTALVTWVVCGAPMN